MKYIKVSGLCLLVFFLFAFGTTGGNNSSKLSLVKKYKLNVPEPSGLSFDSSKKFLLMVSDNNGKLYKSDLQGIIISKKKIIDSDLEGITIINDSSFAVISERTRKIIFLDKEYNILNIINTGLKGSENKGFEGIAFIPTENILLIANEQNPTSIYKFSLAGKFISEHPIPFAKDISGLFYDSTRNSIWILSEKSSMVFRCNLNFQIIENYEIPDKQFEGIVIDNDNMFLVSDKTETLYHYKIIE